MKSALASLILVASSLLAAQSSSAAAAVGLEELIRSGFAPVASGELITDRKMVPVIDAGILAHGNLACERSTERIFMATIEGELPRECEVGVVSVRYGTFMRLVRGDEEYVCVRDGAVRCHPVSKQENR